MQTPHISTAESNPLFKILATPIPETESSDNFFKKALEIKLSNPQIEIFQHVKNIEDINHQWDKYCDKFNIETLNAYVSYAISQVAKSISALSEVNAADIDKIKTLFTELNILVKRYHPHYPKVVEPFNIPLEQLLSALSKKPALISGIADAGIYSQLNLFDLVKLWVKSTPLSSKVSAQISLSLGVLASKNFFNYKQLPIKFLMTRFESDLEKANAQSIISWLEGLCHLSQHQSLKHPINVSHIHLILKKLKNISPITSQQAYKITKSLSILSYNSEILNVTSLNCNDLGFVLSRSIKSDGDVESTSGITYHLASILDMTGNQGSVSFDLLEELLNCAKSQSLKTKTPAERAKHIGIIINSIGEIVKTKPFLYTHISEKTIKQLDDLFEILFDIESNTTRKSTQTEIENYKIIVEAMVSALRGSALLGISQPSEISKKLSRKVAHYLENYKYNFSKDYYHVLTSQYALYVDVTTSRNEKLPPWLQKALQAQKPKPPHPNSKHGQVVKALESKGYIVEPEKLYGSYPYPLDIYYREKPRKTSAEESIVEGICELNGKNYHSGEHRKGESKDLFKSYQLNFKYGIGVQFFDPKLKPESIVAGLSPTKVPRESKTASPTSQVQLYQHIANIYSVKKDPWLITVGKTAAGTLPEEPESTIPLTFSIDESIEDLKKDKKRSKKKTKSHTDDQRRAERLIEFAEKGDLAGIKECLIQGNPKNPFTGKNDPYTVVVALLCAMQKEQLVTEPTQKKCLQEVIKELINRISVENLTQLTHNISPLVLAIKWKDRNSEIYKLILNKVSGTSKNSHRHRKKKSEKNIGTKDIIQKAIELAEKIDLPLINASLLKPEKSAENIEDKKQIQIPDVKSPKSDSEPENRDPSLNTYLNTSFVRDDISPLILLDRARKGHTRSQYLLAIHAHLGRNMEADKNLAAFWYQKAADQGSPFAQHNLACMYLLGDGVPKDLKLGLELLKKAAKQNLPEALYVLGTIYEHGEGFEDFPGFKKDFSRALILYKKAAEFGSDNAQFKLGSIYYKGWEHIQPDLQEAKKFFKRAAEQGHGISQLNIGLIYKAEGNFAEAFPFFENAASQKLPIAIYQVGLAYLNGEGVQVNFKMAVAYFEHACQKNVPKAKTVLGCVYHAGQAVKKDTKKAISLLEEAAEHDPSALMPLGMIYNNPEESVFNPNLAFKYYRAAVEIGVPGAREYLKSLLKPMYTSQITPQQTTTDTSTTPKEDRNTSELPLKESSPKNLIQYTKSSNFFETSSRAQSDEKNKTPAPSDSQQQQNQENSQLTRNTSTINLG